MLYYLKKIIFNLVGIKFIYRSRISSHARIYPGSTIFKSSIGSYSYVVNSKIFHATIGKFVSIGEGCIIGAASHPIDMVSTSPIFLEGNNPLRKNFSKHKYNPYKETHIGNDVWIGNNVLIKGGVKIGDGSIIGMGSIVTKDIPAYAIVAGNPAKLIRMRFSQNLINKLKSIKWWDMSDKKIKHYVKYFDNPNKIIDQ